MKTKLFLCAMGGVMMLAASCTDDLDLGPDAAVAGDEPGTVEVALNLGGEYATVYDSPLTRAEKNKKLYAVNVYYKLPIDLGEPQSPYAYGLFDDVRKMKLKLSDKYVYRFECAIVEEGMNKLAYGPTNNNNNSNNYFYAYPFINYMGQFMEKRNVQNNPGQWTFDFPSGADADKLKYYINMTAERNKFKFSNLSEDYRNVLLNGIKDGKTYVQWKSNNFKWEDNYLDMNAPVNKVIEVVPSFGSIGEKPEYTFSYLSKNTPAMDRWYGTVITTAQPNATLDMRRIAHGINLEVTLPTDGKLTVEGMDSLGNSLFNFDMAYDPSKKNYTERMTSVFTFAEVEKYYKYLNWAKTKAQNAEDYMKSNPTWDEKKLNAQLADDYKKWKGDSVKTIDKICCPIYVNFKHKRSDGSENSYEMVRLNNTGKKERGFIPKRNRMTNIIVDAREIMSDASIGMYEEQFYTPEPSDTIILK